MVIRRTHGRAGSRLIDISKTNVFVGIELCAKVISAISLVVLGAAGWGLQAKTEAARERAEQHDRQERLYLPVLRSLAEIELVLEDTAYQLRHPSAKGDELSQQEYELGTRLRVAAYGVFIPEGDQIVILRSRLLSSQGP